MGYLENGMVQMMQAEVQPNVISNPLFQHWGKREQDYDTSFISEGYVSAFKEGSSTLLVTFEVKTDENKPFAAPLAEEAGISFLTILTDREDWFRDDTLFTYFDELTDQGFFDQFDDIVFFGVGMCGYAAAAFSVVAPGATVVAIAPQATLDPTFTSWDKRYVNKRRLDFTSRFGFAPQMVQGADKVFVIYDPVHQEDAIHAALFNGPNVEILKCGLHGPSAHEDLELIGVLTEIIDAACEGELSKATYHQLLRARRRSKPYAATLLTKLREQGRTKLASRLAAWASRRYDQTYFRDQLDEMEGREPRAVL